MSILQRGINIGVSLVWLINGLFCKVLNLVPRHREIVATILGEDHASLFTKMIGAGEILVAVWILSGIRPKACAIFQIILIGVMNIIEFFMVPDLLLFGRFNLLFAVLFMFIIYLNAFKSKENY